MSDRDGSPETSVQRGPLANGTVDSGSINSVGGKEVVAWRAFDPTRTGAVVENYHDGILVIDPNNRIVLANRQARLITRYQLHELLGKHFEMLIPERFRGRHVQHVVGYRNDPRTRLMGTSGMRLFLLDKHGNEKPVQISLTELESDDGGVDVVVGIKLQNVDVGG